MNRNETQVKSQNFAWAVTHLLCFCKARGKLCSVANVALNLSFPVSDCVLVFVLPTPIFCYESSGFKVDL